MIPFHRYPALKSRDPDEALASILRRQPGVHNMEPVIGPNRRWGIDVNFLALGQIGITSTRSSAYSLSSAPDGLVRIWVPFGSPFRMDYRSQSRQFAMGKPGFSPLEEVRAHFEAGFRTLLVTVPIKLLAEAVQRFGPPKSFQSLLQTSEKASGAALDMFVAHLTFVVRSIDQHTMILDEERFKLLHQELLVLHLSEALVRSADFQGKAISSRTLRLALELIGDRIREDFRMSEVADHAGCSLRSLQIAFRTELQTTVTGYIRAERLKLARRMLQTTEARSTVSEIALESGFNHLGEFARRYREAYGERPSDTLKNSNKSKGLLQ